MSRRLLPTHGPVPSTSDNPYQSTTTKILLNHAFPRHHRGSLHRPAEIAPPLSDRLSDGTLTDSVSYYEYCYPPRSFSDASASSSNLGFGEITEAGRKSFRNTYSSDIGWKIKDGVNPLVHKDARKIYPVHQHMASEAGLYQEVPSNVLPRRLPNSNLSDRPHSSLSSGVTSAVVDGCGGKCQTFENVCYFFLQLLFMMGILIGASLCIAGLVLRKSAARNLQVLVYIGVLLATVSGLLLGIQWRARSLTKKRKLAVRNAKRAPIPLEIIQNRNQQAQLPLVVLQNEQRVSQIDDQQGIPWWRRKDII